MPDKPTFHDVAIVAKSNFGAPSDIDQYEWHKASIHEENFLSITKAGTDLHVPLDYTSVTTYGRLSVGWDEEHRVAAFAWDPPDSDR